jgi:hypothetical protein
LDALIRSGKLIDGKTILGLLAWKRYSTPRSVK